MPGKGKGVGPGSGICMVVPAVLLVAVLLIL